MAHNIVIVVITTHVMSSQLSASLPYLFGAKALGSLVIWGESGLSLRRKEELGRNLGLGPELLGRFRFTHNIIPP